VKKLLFAALLLILVPFAHTQTLTSTAPKCTAVTTITCQPVSVTLPSSTTPPVVTPPVTTPVPVGAAWVYQNGSFNWEGDYSFGATISYKDTAGGPTGTYDLKVVTTSGGGGWQPFALGKQFDVRGFSKLTYCVKPTSAGLVIGTGFAAINDVADGNIINIGAGTPYGPAPQAGVWGCYVIPLKDFALTNPLIQKFTIATGTGATYYVDNVGFLP